MNAHGLRVIQYREALDLVAARASSTLGAAAVQANQPSDARSWIHAELLRVDEMRGFMGSAGDWSPPPIPDVRAALRRLGVEGSVLEASELRDIGELLRSSRLARRVLRAESSARPLLAEVSEPLAVNEKLEDRIATAVDDAGEVRDTASRELSRLRRELRGARARIVEQLERYMAALPSRYQVSDASVSVREGRYVVPIRREGRVEVGGLVHDESATGATLFVEPPIALELMSELRELERAEAREVLRILRELTEAVRPAGEAVAGSLNALVALDTLYARARYAADYDAHRPEVGGRGDSVLCIVNGRHPLLLAGDGPVVPFDLVLEGGERTLLVSGPNTGGKTVLLKAVGLIAALTQSGVIPPVGPGTKLPVFGDVFADIGDEQSIEASLSTFSAHVKHLREIVEHADGAALALIDEMGSGTDPAEGAALARAILLELTERGVRTIASTHLGDLKRLAAEHEGVVNASLQFDAAELRPTYRLIKGVPGRSYGLAIARRLGLPEHVLARAESALPIAEREAERLLGELETKERELAGALAEAERVAVETAAAAADVAARAASLRSRERQSEAAARQQARALLLEAREEVEAAIREVRQAGVDAEAFKAARRRVEEAAARVSRVSGEEEEAGEGVGAGRGVGAGVRVRVLATGAVGTVVEVRDGRAMVETRGMRMQIPVGGLERVESEEREGGTVRTGGWSAPDFDAASEVDLRGLRADEAVAALQPAVDAAIQAALPALRIIHGKGTGALREVVSEILKADPRIRTFRAGGVGEGGTGVTVVELS